MKKYYNPITEEYTLHKYRFKTKKEFIEEFGDIWMDIVKYTWVSSMNYLLGKDVGFSDSWMDSELKYHGYTISKEMYIENSTSNFKEIYCTEKVNCYE